MSIFDYVYIHPYLLIMIFLRVSASDTATICMGNALSADSSVRDNNNRIILFKASTDGGNSFKNTKSITTNLGGGTAELYPKIAAAGNDVYLTWSVGMLTSRVEDEISSKYQ